MMDIMVPPKYVERTISFAITKPSVASSWHFYFHNYVSCKHNIVFKVSYMFRLANVAIIRLYTK
jgi:hypothetical protein